MRIGLDLDGVIIDHRPNKLALARDFGYVLEPWQVNSNVIDRHLEPHHHETFREKLYTHLTLSAPAMHGALEAISRLPGEVHIISARRPRSAPYAEMWLMNCGLLHQVIPKDRILFVGHPSEKRGHVERLGIEVFLDDELRVLHDLPENVHRCFFDSDGLSERLDVKPEIRRVESWVAFLEALR